MRFGGHESFPIREGWLTKALTELDKDPKLFRDKLACDRLGVGRNMAKSMKHWLRTAGLAEPADKGHADAITDVGRLIMKEDQYFLRQGTWWALHINIATSQKQALAWGWFFSHFHADRFDRMRCSAELHRHLKLGGERMPSGTTIGRDIACLLASYAQPIPPSDSDPEEALDSPFVSLGLLEHLRETDTYRFHRKAKAIPASMVGYALAAAPNGHANGKSVTIPLAQVIAAPYGPAHTLVLSPDSFMDIAAEAEKELGPDLLHIELSGGERTLRYHNQKPRDWLKHYYRSDRQ